MRLGWRRQWLPVLDDPDGQDLGRGGALARASWLRSASMRLWLRRMFAACAVSLLGYNESSAREGMAQPGAPREPSVRDCASRIMWACPTFLYQEVRHP
jgi:hypothetical protein